jgi:S1-C subfamily serine protease
MGFDRRGFARVAGLVCCGVSFAIGSTSGAVAAPGAGDTAAPADSVYVVEARSPDGAVRRGSAVALTRDTFDTNCHVTRRAATIMLARGDRTWHATLRAGSGELDLCILSVPLAAARAVHVRDASSVAVGETVYAVGFPVGQGVAILSGTVKALHRHENSNIIQESASFEVGSSGGGLFDRDGSLVGVLTFKIVGGEGYYFALPTDWISRVQDRYGSARAGADETPAFWERSPGALPSFLENLALDAGGRRRTGTSALTSAGPDR